MSKELVVYYSHSGNTRKAADLISKLTGADILELVPKIPYDRGLWEAVDEFKEELAGDLRRELVPYDVDISQYDTIYIGTPNWGATVATPLLSFFDAESLEDKCIAPFITHGGGGVGNCNTDIIKYSGAKNFKSPLVFAGGSISEKKVKAWLERD